MGSARGVSIARPFKDCRERATAIGGRASLVQRPEPNRVIGAAAAVRNCGSRMAESVRIIQTTGGLQEYCEALAKEKYICVDTEFVRERTYWPVLCLVQLGVPSGRREDAALVDPLAEGIDLSPLFALMDNAKVLKVFHSGAQDFEIFCHFGNGVPGPVFDTQVGAAFCGYGQQAAYQSLVRSIARRSIDKGLRVTDWHRRPLAARQIEYATDDVLYLPAIYRSVQRRLKRSGRTVWVAEELRTLAQPERFRNDPERAWLRLRSRSQDPRLLAILREVAAWREREAQRRDIPRQHVLGDSVLIEIAKLAPEGIRDLTSLRSLQRRGRRLDRDGNAILAAVRRGISCPEEERPSPNSAVRISESQSALASLLKVLLKALAAEQGIAEAIVATAEDIERMAMDFDADVPLLRGWRREVFGEDLLRLCRGEVAVAVAGRRVVSVELPRTVRED